MRGSVEGHTSRMRALVYSHAHAPVQRAPMSHTLYCNMHHTAPVPLTQITSEKTYIGTLWLGSHVTANSWKQVRKHFIECFE
jgi:hypothetical protein